MKKTPFNEIINPLPDFGYEETEIIFDEISEFEDEPDEEDEEHQEDDDFF